MATSAYEQINPLNSYADAVKYIEKTKPIRGSGNIPLGKRRDNDRFRIEKLANGDIACWHYDVQLVTYHPDGTVTIDPTNNVHIRSGKRTPYWSTSDTYFIGEILYAYYLSVNTRRGVLMIKDRRSDEKFLLEPTKAYHFKLDHDKRTLTPMDEANGLPTLKLNRTATNNVRQRYGQFYRYMKGMLGVRKEVHEHTYFDTYGDEVHDSFQTVMFTAGEFAEVVPLAERQERHMKTATKYFDWMTYGKLPCDKPPVNSQRGEYDAVSGSYVVKYVTEPYEKWKANTETLLAWMSATEDDPEQHDKYRKAFSLIGVCAAENRHRLIPNLEITFSVRVEKIQKMADEIIFKYHSEEVLEPTTLKPGLVPSTKYESWVTRDKD